VEPLILAIETATRAGSVTLARGHEFVHSTSGDAAVSHSTDLLEMVEIVLQAGRRKLSEVDLFAAARGPGSFTGLRIGLATIKSFAVATGKNCAGVSTLAAIAYASGESEKTVALLPAGRGEVFSQMFSVRDDQVRELDAAAHLKPETVLQRYGAFADLKWSGEGAHFHQELLRRSAQTRDFSFTEESSNGADHAGKGWTLSARVEQLSHAVATLALISYREGQTVSPDTLRADYVRASDAEINEQWQPEK